MNELPAEWLDWQRAHAVALAALQDAQRAYHRTVIQSATTGAQSVTGAQSATGAQTPAVGSQPGAMAPLDKLDGLARLDRLARLDSLERARARLDEVRAQRPPFPDCPATS